jgi:hypothetical protein
MGLIESDPRDVNYIALLTAIKWYEEISSEIAIRIAKGSSHRKPGRHLTPEVLTEIKRIMANSNFTSVDAVVKKYRISKYEILEAITGDKNANEEGLILLKVNGMFEKINSTVQVETMLQVKKIKEKAELCKADNCENCILDCEMAEDLTVCEFLCENEIDIENAQRVYNFLKNIHVRQMYDKCMTSENLNGTLKRKTYWIDTKAEEEINRYKKSHPNEKMQDIISLALLEYTNKHT